MKTIQLDEIILDDCFEELSEECLYSIEGGCCSGRWGMEFRNDNCSD